YVGYRFFIQELSANTNEIQPPEGHQSKVAYHAPSEDTKSEVWQQCQRREPHAATTKKMYSTFVLCAKIPEHNTQKRRQHNQEQVGRAHLICKEQSKAESARSYKTPGAGRDPKKHGDREYSTGRCCNLGNQYVPVSQH